MKKEQVVRPQGMEGAKEGEYLGTQEYKTSVISLKLKEA
jgi:hypothetical protein